MLRIAEMLVVAITRMLVTHGAPDGDHVAAATPTTRHRFRPQAASPNTNSGTEMLRLTKMLTVVVLMAATTFLTQAAPAAAHTDACTGNGIMNTSGGFAELAVTPFLPRTRSFVVSLVVGTCVLQSSFSMAGTMDGWCGFSSAQGVTNTGHRFAFVNVGTALLFTGEVTGPGTLTVDALSGQSCLPLTGATRFLINIAVELRHCTVTKAMYSTPDPIFGVVFWGKVCA